jgi:predicted short-subunit dehydrogenase-like oxidoreductase (DUF2520 family)
MPARKKRKPTIAIIGSGRLGSALAIALERKGYSVEYLVARRQASARRAAAFLDAGSTPLATKELSEVPNAELLLIATPDDQIASVAAWLNGLKINKERKPTALHTSGALSAKVLAALSKKGWSVGSLHPLVSVSEPRAGARSLRGAFWCVEGDPAAVRIAKTVVSDLEGKSFSIASDHKPLYHAAAVMASGNVIALFDAALEMLGQCGLKRTEAQRILLPLLLTAVKNLGDKDPAEALTGTFSRGDVETVKLHLAALKNNELPDALELYRLLGKRSLRLSKRNIPEITRILKSV